LPFIVYFSGLTTGLLPTLLAIAQILERLKALAGKELGVSDLENIAISKEKVVYAGKETDLSWDHLAKVANLARVNLSAHAFYATPGLEFNRIR